MAVQTTHPLYEAMRKAWKDGQLAYQGERAVKAQGREYLQPTDGQIADGFGTKGSVGQQSYDSYKEGAVFPSDYQEAVENNIGIMHAEEANIELPSEMEGMLQNATLLGENLQSVLRKINFFQLVSGRLGLMGDFREVDNEIRPVLLIYPDLSVRDWDDDSTSTDTSAATLVVLDETGYERDSADYSWKLEHKYRVLALVDSNGRFDPTATNKVYGYAELKEDGIISSAEYTVTNIRGQTLDRIPFSFINASDLSPSPSRPPLAGVAQDCFTIYRGEAYYRRHLRQQSEDTLVILGQASRPAGEEDKPLRTGAGAVIEIPTNGGDAKYIGVESQGLSEQRNALENDYNRVKEKSGKLTNATSRQRESGEALTVRLAAQTASLTEIAIAGAQGLQKVLRDIAVWMGANPEEVIVEPFLDFDVGETSGKELVDLASAKSMDFPISMESMHAYAREKGFTKMTFEDEMARINNEEPGFGSGGEGDE